MAGILLFGLISRKLGSNWSPAVISTGTTLYGAPASSRKILTFQPFGVGQ
jgi:hypothetical protein